MKKIYSLMIASAMIGAFALQARAQCAGNRYHDYVFPATPTPTSNIVYGNNLSYTNAATSLKLDVYQPVGDVATNRALVIVAHGGSFVGGSKSNSEVTPFCIAFAKLGYVVASIDYRIGMTGFPFSDSTEAGAAVMRGVHDGRAAVRFFKQNYATGGNTYGIDTNNIYFAGFSAGGLIALHLAYMDQLAEFPNYVDTTAEAGLHGGIEGVSGNPGYTSNVRAIINVCGALGDTLWMQAGDEPVLSFHGTADNTVPYGYAYIHPFGTNIIKVHGSSTVAMRASNLGMENCMETWPGKDHEPENTVPSYYDSIITISRTFLEHYTCGTAMNCSYTATPAVGIYEPGTDTEFTIYPNPASTEAMLDLSAFAGKPVDIELFDNLGRKIVQAKEVRDQRYSLKRPVSSSGIYYLRLSTEGHVYGKKIIFE